MMNFDYCEGITHVIKAGDTLYLLSKTYQVPLAAIMRANPYVDVYNLTIGDELCIPVPAEYPGGQEKPEGGEQPCLHCPGVEGRIRPGRMVMPEVSVNIGTNNENRREIREEDTIRRSSNTNNMRQDRTMQPEMDSNRDTTSANRMGQNRTMQPEMDSNRDTTSANRMGQNRTMQPEMDSNRDTTSANRMGQNRTMQPEMDSNRDTTNTNRMDQNRFVQSVMESNRNLSNNNGMRSAPVTMPEMDIHRGTSNDNRMRSESMVMPEMEGNTASSNYNPMRSGPFGIMRRNENQGTSGYQARSMSYEMESKQGTGMKQCQKCQDRVSNSSRKVSGAGKLINHQRKKEKEVMYHEPTISVGRMDQNGNRPVRKLTMPAREEDYSEHLISYIMKDGDTLESILMQFDMDMDDLLKFNTLADICLKAGCILKIPEIEDEM